MLIYISLFTCFPDGEGNSQRFSSPRPNPPPPPPQAIPSQPKRHSRDSNSPARNRPQTGPKLGPKPNIQWPPRIRANGSEKPHSPQRGEFNGRKPISENEERRDERGSGNSQADGSYEVMWDYFSENGGETEEDRLRNMGDSDVEEHWGEQFYAQGSYEPSSPRHRMPQPNIVSHLLTTSL